MRELRPRTWREIVTAFLLSAYVGYKVRGMGRAVGAATASFLPSFVLMLGLIPGVIGVMLVALVRMVPYAAPDPLAIAALMVTTVVLIVWRTAPVKAAGRMEERVSGTGTFQA